MELLAALIGAVIGGCLVLVGDAVSRRQERRHETMRQLVHAAADLASANIRIIGAAIDAREKGVAEGHLDLLTPDRYEALTRFFMQPGSEKLRDEATALSHRVNELLAAYAGPDESWTAARLGWRESLFAFEAAMRAIGRRGLS